MTLNPEVFKFMKELPKHRQLCQELMDFFFSQNEIIGGFIAGSGASGGMDDYSDLDLGFVCKNEAGREKFWSDRFNWPLPSWFHRMDADHVKPYFIIYLFDPQIHVDLSFYTMSDLPPKIGGPFTIGFDKEKQIETWMKEVNRPLHVEPDWSSVVHEEERFWTWIHFAWCHVGRGEYYDIASQFGFLRDIPHQWYARLKGFERFNSRRLEARGEIDFVERMQLCCPQPERDSLKAAILNLIDFHNYQRAEVDLRFGPKWKTTEAAREKITQLVRDL